MSSKQCAGTNGFASDREMARRRELESWCEHWYAAWRTYKEKSEEADAAYSRMNIVRDRVEDAAILVYGKEGIHERMMQIQRDRDSAEFYDRQDAKKSPPPKQPDALEAMDPYEKDPS